MRLAVVLAVVATANIVPLNFRLAERALHNQYRFSFSDFGGKTDLKDAMVKFDLEIRPSHTKQDTNYALFIIESDEKSSTEMEEKILAKQSQHERVQKMKHSRANMMLY